MQKQYGFLVMIEIVDQTDFFHVSSLFIFKAVHEENDFGNIWITKNIYYESEFHIKVSKFALATNIFSCPHVNKNFSYNKNALCI